MEFFFFFFFFFFYYFFKEGFVKYNLKIEVFLKLI